MVQVRTSAQNYASSMNCYANVWTILFSKGQENGLWQVEYLPASSHENEGEGRGSRRNRVL